MFVTSIAEVVAPGIDNLLVVFVYQSFDFSQLLAPQIVIVGKFHFGFQPELGLAIAAVRMNVNPRLLP